MALQEDWQSSAFIAAHSTAGGCQEVGSIIGNKGRTAQGLVGSAARAALAAKRRRSSGARGPAGRRRLGRRGQRSKWQRLSVPCMSSLSRGCTSRDIDGGTHMGDLVQRQLTRGAPCPRGRSSCRPGPSAPVGRLRQARLHGGMCVDVDRCGRRPGLLGRAGCTRDDVTVCIAQRGAGCRPLLWHCCGAVCSTAPTLCVQQVAPQSPARQNQAQHNG